MKRYRRFLFVVLFTLTVVCVFFAFAISEESVTITGIVNEDYQFIADNGQIYIVAEPERVVGLDESLGKRLKVMGIVEESDGNKIITITSLEVIKE